MGIVVILVAGVFFLGIGFLIMRMICAATGIQDRSLKIGVFCLSVWLLWRQFQLPPEQTGGGYYLAAQRTAVDPGHQASPAR